VRHYTSTLTISNLTVSAPSGSTNTLYLDNTGTIALHILDGLTIGISLDNYGDPVSGGGELISTNSTLIVDGMLGGQLEDDGTMVITGGSLITTNCSLLVATLDENPSGLLIISNAVVQARDVGMALGPSSSGTIEIFGGTMNLSSSLTIGLGNYPPPGGDGTLLIADGCLLVVTNDDTDIVAGIMTVSNASFLAADVFLGSERSGGELAINNGTVTLSGELFIGLYEGSGSVSLNGGVLTVTNDTTTLGEERGYGTMTIEGGVFLARDVSVGYFASVDILTVNGGISILSSNLQIGADLSETTVAITGGQLLVTNAPITVDDGGQCSVSGGQLAAGTIELGRPGNIQGGGMLTVSGGSITVSDGMTLGDCNDIYALGYTSVDGGQLIVTNAAGTGFIDIQNGQLTLNSGTLQVDNLVMTNTCSSFIHTGGTLIVRNVILDPNAFQITSVSREGNNLRVSWLMAPGSTNALQVSCGGVQGACTTNGFTDIFVVTNNPSPGTLTNYLDVGGATNIPSRYYRARLAL
jgi:hypothetical protein